MGNVYFVVVEKMVVEQGVGIVVIFVVIEEEISQLEDDEVEMFLIEMGLEEVGFDCLICVGYDLLQLEIYFIVGLKEVCVWMIKVGIVVLQVVGVIYGDFECGFICVEIIGYDDYVDCNGESGVKEVGKMCVEGKGYVVKDGDVMYFLFNM